MNTTNHSRNIAIGYFIYILIILLWGNNWITLWDQDEAAYAGFAKNMIESGNYLIPDFMWSTIHRKTPLHFWTICLSYKIFGYNEFAVRFPSAICIWLTIIIIYLYGKKIWGEKQSLVSSIILSTTFLVMGLAKVAVTDAGVLFYSTLCGFSMVHVLLYRKKIQVFIFWISFSLALLTKGPPIIIFTVLFGSALFFFHPQRKNLVLLHPWIGMPLSLLPLFYWGYLCSQTEGGKQFIDWLVDWYILKRVGGSVLGQSGPPGTHLLGMIIIFIGYLVWLPNSIFSTIKNWRKNKNYEDAILIIWFISSWLIYEFSPSKLPSYVITAHIPLALMIGKTMMNAEAPTKKYLKTIQLIIYCLIFLAIAAVPVIFKLNILLTIMYITLGIGLLVLYLFITFNTTKFVLIKKNEFLKSLPTYSLNVILFNVLFNACIWLVILPASDFLKNSTYITAQYINQNVSSNATIIIANNSRHPPSLPFYLMQNFTNVIEEYDQNNLISEYNNKNNIAIILNKNQLIEFQKNYPNILYHEIKSFSSDFIKSENYYVIHK